MRLLRGPWAAVAAVTLFLLTACARPATPGGGTSGEPAPSRSPAPATGDALVLRVERVGGLMAPDQMPGRLPLVSVYADGRLITEGPQIAVYPPPALPNLGVQRLDRATVTGLVDKALAAGVRSGADLGRPSVADAPTTRITVAAGDGRGTLDVVALSEARPDDPRLTVAQRDARAKLAAFVQELTDLSAARGVPEPKPYRPESVAALARPYVKPSGALPKPPAPIAWPGPALPGAVLTGTTGCVTATGAAAAAVLAAAGSANAITPWRSGDKLWSVRFRPLLPDESGCADLAAR
jgi:hypothetical protein